MKKKQKKRKAKTRQRMSTRFDVVMGEVQGGTIPITLEPGDTVTDEIIFEISEAGDLSHEDISRSLRDAVRAEMPEEDGHYCWLEAVYDDKFVYEAVSPDSRQLYRRSYSIDAEGNVLMGVPEAVKKVISYEPEDEPAEPAAMESKESGTAEEIELHESATEISGPVIPLMETKVRSDGTLPILLINEGWGSSGYYPRKVLERDAGIFTKGVQMHLDHMTRAEEAARPEGSVTTIAAVLDGDAYFNESGPEGPGVYGDAKVMEHQKDLVEALAPYVGLSIHASGIARPGEAEGKKGPIIERIVRAKRVDFVTMAGRGGKVLEIMEAALPGQVAPAAEEETTPIKESDMNEEEVKELQESNEKLAQDNARLQEAIILREAGDVVATAMADPQYKDVPEMTLNRVREAQVKNPPVKDGALDAEALKTRVHESVKAEVQYLADLTDSGKVRSIGGNANVSESVTAEERTSKLESQFQRLGLSESASRHAATGRR